MNNPETRARLKQKALDSPQQEPTQNYTRMQTLQTEVLQTSLRMFEFILLHYTVHRNVELELEYVINFSSIHVSYM